MEIKSPFNLQSWINDNRHLLKPPVGNKNLYVESGDYIVMIVAGPNARKDYHYNETEELFVLSALPIVESFIAPWASSICTRLLRDNVSSASSLTKSLAEFLS